MKNINEVNDFFDKVRILEKNNNEQLLKMQDEWGNRGNVYGSKAVFEYNDRKIIFLMSYDINIKKENECKNVFYTICKLLIKDEISPESNFRFIHFTQ